MILNKEDVYNEYYLKVLRYIQSKVNDYYLAEEICSDVFLKIYEKLDTYDPKKAGLSTWIFTIVRNKLIDYYRSRKVTVEVPEDLTYDEDEPIFSNEDLEKLANALEKLNPKEKEVIVKYYYSDITLKDIATQMGISYAYVKILHKKSLLKLKKML